MAFRFVRLLPLMLAALAGGAHAAEPVPAPGAARLDRGALDALRAAAPEAAARVVLRWSGATTSGSAPKTQDIATILRRIEVYAPDARVLEATADGYRELPRDSRLHFVGIGTVGQRFGLSLDPKSGVAEGILLRDGRMFALQGASDAEGLLLAARDMNAPLSDGDVAVGSCSGNMSLDSTIAVPKAGGESITDGIALKPTPAGRRAISFAPKVATRQTTVAVDTDNNFLSRKFSNNTTSATNYVAALFTALNAIYEDDPAQYGLQLRLLQGTVILRPSTTPDPFLNNDTSATGAALTEFGGWWRTNQGSASRAFALLLSGNSSNQNSASGIAWLVTGGSYCAATGSGVENFGHYSVNQVFWNPALAASEDAYLVAHELGHNLGARHTHCASAANGGQASTGTIDRCFNGESGFGCYAGVQACPSGAESPVAPQGTLMSYCHLNGLGCGVSTELHPTHVSQLNGRLASQPTSCVGPISGGGGTAPTITAPASFTATEDTTLVLSGVSFTDPDSSSITATFSLPPSSGSINGTSGGGVTVGGTASARTLAGSPANLGSFISGGNLSFVPLANSTTSVTLTIQASDGTNSATPRSPTIALAAVNDPPTVNLPGTIGFTEDLAGTVVPVSFADVDAGTGNMLATFSVPAGTLSATSGAGVTVGGSATARTLAGTLAALNDFLSQGGLAYTGAANANGAVTLTVSINDQGNTGSGGAQVSAGNTTLQITPANDAPTVSAPASLSLMAGATAPLTSVVYADPDAPYGGNVVATYAAPSGTFAATSGSGVTVAGSGTGTLTLTGSLASINAFVAATPVQYTAAAAASGVVPITLTINDQGNVGGAPLSGNRVVNATVMAAGTIFVDGFEP